MHDYVRESRETQAVPECSEETPALAAMEP